MYNMRIRKQTEVFGYEVDRYEAPIREVGRYVGLMCVSIFANPNFLNCYLHLEQFLHSASSAHTCL